LDISIVYPGSTSDCLAFEGSSLYGRLKDGSFMCPGLCLFGDNAYLNSPSMATPYTGVSAGSQDAYNFYHSQLRFRIECAFGMLTQRWGILQSAFPKTFLFRKQYRLFVPLQKSTISVLKTMKQSWLQGWQETKHMGKHLGRFLLKVLMELNR